MSFPKGYRAAVSLTFDDGLPVQREHAIPLLDRYDMAGTFFLIVKSPYEPSQPLGFWATAAQRHEIGAHSVHHGKAADLTASQMMEEAKESKRFWQDVTKRPVTSYCYPFTDAPRAYQSALARSGYLCARGGRVARRDKFMVPGQEINPFNLPCHHIGDALFDHDVVYSFIDCALERGAWLILMFHGIGPDPKQWDNVNSQNFEELLKFLGDRRHRKGLWVETMGKVFGEGFKK